MPHDAPSRPDHVDTQPANRSGHQRQPVTARGLKIELVPLTDVPRNQGGAAGTMTDNAGCVIRTQ
jgi:hypothetical protein